MSKGYVYILTNPSMPGMVKIGRTSNEPSSRAWQLYSTGVPEPFSIFHFSYSPDHEALEMEMHNHFADFRVSQAREFFRVDAEEAKLICKDLNEGIISDLVFEFLPDFTIGQAMNFIDDGQMRRLMYETGRDIYSVWCALHNLRGDDIAHRLRPEKADITSDVIACNLAIGKAE